MRTVLRLLTGLSIALAAALLASASARAANVGVRYVVDAKALKDAVAGTQLTFSLFSDSGCSTEIFSTSVAVEDVSRIEALKLIRPKGAPKAPKTAALEHELTGVDAAPQMYLTVSGTGVEPVGATCQAQAAIGLAVWSHGNGLGNGSTLQPHECTSGGGGPIAGAQLYDVVVVAHETMPQYIRVWAELVPNGVDPPSLTWHICNDSEQARQVPGGVGATAYGLRP